jgi:competence protein ComEA
MSWVAFAAGAIVAALVAAGAVLLVYDDLTAPPIVIEELPLDGTIVVEISGAVGTPGVYEVSVDARIADVITVAGGTSPDADLGAINLARRVHDEDEILIPSRSPTPAPASADEPAPATEAAEGRVNINTATVAELDTLPGIGPVLAQRIIDDRAEHGPFQTVDELARVSGISAAMVDELRPLITVGG